MSTRLHLLLGLTTLLTVACHEESKPTETTEQAQATPSPSATPTPSPAAAVTPSPTPEPPPPPPAAVTQEEAPIRPSLPDSDNGPADTCHDSHHCIYADSTGHIHLLREGEKIPPAYVAKAPAIEEMARERHWQLASPVDSPEPVPSATPTPSATPAVAAPVAVPPPVRETPPPPRESPSPEPSRPPRGPL